ncbi:PD40 domain-containing protein [Candidatus Woesearchaeota archaeon]|nr:PD40 domain-containing protein [Candidatus Woesearchaeota archaeon]
MNFKKRVKSLVLSTILATSLISGCSKTSDPTAPEQTQHTEIQSSITDKNGYATFNNDGSQLRVKCASQSNQPIQNVQVFYNNGSPENRYEVLSFLPGNNYRPITRFDTNLNDKIDVVELLQHMNDSDYILRQITGTDEKTALRNFLDFYLPNLNEPLLLSSFRYGGTFTGEQLRDSYRIAVNTLLFVGSSVSGGPVPINEVLSGIGEDISLEDILTQNYSPETNWDLYWFSPFGLPTKAFHVLMPSNKPTVTQKNPQITGSNVILSWQGQDAKNYFQNLIPIPDPTIKFGATINSDLFYTINVFRNNQLYTTSGTNQLTKTLTNLPEGQYRVIIEVIDDTNVNKTSTTDTGTDKTFTIGSTPTQEKIVFTRDLETYSMSSNGTNLTRIESGTNPSVNISDGSIAMEKTIGGKSEIVVKYSDGSTSGITSSTEGSHSPSFGWQGNRIVYIKDGDLYTTFLPTGLESLVVSNGSPQEPCLNQTGDKIVFSTNVDNNWEIRSCKVDGTYPTRLTNNSLLDSAPNFSNDGTKIVFTRSDKIWIMNSDGSNQVALTQGTTDRYPCFSPDGTEIAYSRWINGSWDLWTMKVDGSNQTNKTNSSGISETQPDWK